MRLFPLRFILLGLLLCIFHVWCRTCGSDFSDPQSSAYLANIVFEGTVSQSFAGDVRYNISVDIKKAYKGEDLLRHNGEKRVRSVIIGEFGDEDELNCIAKVKINFKYLFFLRLPKSNSVTQPTASSLYFHISAFPVIYKKKTAKSVRKFLGKKATAPKIKSIKSVEQDLRKKVQLVCKVSSKLGVQYMWTKNGKAIKRGVKNGRKQSRLRIKKLSPTDAGTYTCTARNVVGVAQQTTTITVKPKEDISFNESRHTKCSSDNKYLCLNGGICRWYKELGRTSCRCPPEFEGPRCQKGTKPLETKEEFNNLRKLEKDRTLIIIGIVSGVLVFIAICIASFFMAKKRRKQYYLKLEEKKLHKKNNIPQISYRALTNDEMNGPLPLPTSRLRCTSSETQTDSAVLPYCKTKTNGIQAFNSSTKRNSRTRLTAASGNGEHQQLRTRSADGRFFADAAPPPALSPYPEEPVDHEGTMKPIGLSINIDPIRSDDPYIPTIKIVAPSSHPYQMKPTDPSDSNCEKGPFRSPVINIESESDSDSCLNDQVPSLHISEIDISDQRENSGNTAVVDRPFSISQEDSLNHKGEHRLNNDDTRHYDPHSSSSSSTPISNQSNYNVNGAVLANGGGKTNWNNNSSTVPLYACDDASYQEYPILSQSDPALSRGRESGEPTKKSPFEQGPTSNYVVNFNCHH